MMRTIVESHPRYSAIPPHTPNNMLSVVDLFNLAMILIISLGYETIVSIRQELDMFQNSFALGGI